MDAGNIIFLLLAVGGILAMLRMHGRGHAHGGGSGGCGHSHGHDEREHAPEANQKPSTVGQPEQPTPTGTPPHPPDPAH